MDFIALGNLGSRRFIFDKMPKKRGKKLKLAFSFRRINKRVFGERRNRSLYHTHKKTKVRGGCDDKDL